MILDSSSMFDLQAPVTVSRPSTNVLDMLNPRDIGVGQRNLYVLAMVSAALVGPAGTTIQLQYQGSVDNVTFNTIIETVAYPAVSIPAGRQLWGIEVPRQLPFPDAPASAIFRYFRLNIIVGGGPLTSGAITAGIVLERSDIIAYPKNFNINA